MFKSTYEQDVKNLGLETANARMKVIGKSVADYFKGKETAANANAISPRPEQMGGNIYNNYNSVDNSSVSSSQTHLNTNISDAGAPAGAFVRPY